MASDQLGHRIAGAAVHDALDVLVLTDPATGEEVGGLGVASSVTVGRAVRAAAEAAQDWGRTSAGERGASLRALAAAVRARADELARLQTGDNGKPLAMSNGDVETAAATLEQYAELGPVHRGRSLQGEVGALDAMVHEPLGVAALVVPWNDPLGITAGLLGAALAVGDTVVLKPSERAPRALGRLAELCDDAGLPSGVVNVVHGDGRTGSALVAHEGVDVVAFVGSVATGRSIAAACAARLCPCALELGGNDPLLVDADVDPRWAAAQRAQSAFAFSGQICTAVERVYVHADVAEAFVAALAEEAEALVVGDPCEDGTQMGPLVDTRLRAAVHAQVEAAVAGGARLLTGGTIPAGPGAFYPPTVLVDVDDDMAVMREETFGPVAPVRVVADFDEGLACADGTAYGLAATVLTASQAHAQRAVRELRAGTVKVNAVWGGAPGGAAEPRGTSGLRFGYGPELLDELSTTKVVHLEPAPRSA